MATRELVIAPRTGRIISAGVAPAQWPGPGREPALIRATARVGEVRRAVSRVVHEVRYRPPRRRAAKMVVLIPAHDEEASIAAMLTALLGPVAGAGPDRGHRG